MIKTSFDFSQLCDVDGQSIQVVVDDTGGQTFLIAPSTGSAPTTLVSQPINIASSLEQGQSVYIIKTNEPDVQTEAFTRSVSNSKVQLVNKDGSEGVICYTNVPKTIDLEIEKSPKTFISTGTRTLQPVVLPALAAPNVVVQPSSNLNTTRIVPINKRQSAGTGTPVKSNLPGQTIRKIAPGGKMKRASIGTAINHNLQASGTTPTATAGFYHLSERIKADQQATAPLLKQRGTMGQRMGHGNRQQQLQQSQQQQLQQQQQQHTLFQQQQAQQHAAVNQVNAGTQRIKDKSEPMEVDDVIEHSDIEDPAKTIVQHQVKGNEAKMLVILENGEQRLITFEVPKDDCTVADLLEQANIQASQEPRVSLVSDPTLHINYIVDVTAKTSNYDDSDKESSVKSRSPVKSNRAASSTGSTAKVAKYIKGMLAVCPFCGMSAADFNYCMRCKRKLPDDVKSIPISTGVMTKRDNSSDNPSLLKKQDSGLLQRGEMVSKRGRGGCRSRGVLKAKQIKEPECLTISSDEEDDNKVKKSLNNSIEMPKAQVSEPKEKAETINEKEPVITNIMKPFRAGFEGQLTGCGKETATIIPPSTNLLVSLKCRTVGIGSYKFVPDCAVTISSDNLLIDVPLLEDERKSISLKIKYGEMLALLIHFSKSMPVLFFYTNVPTGSRIRDILGMQDPKGPYYDPVSKDQTHKRITLLPERISDEAKLALKEIFRPIMSELNGKEANDILVQASPRAVQVPAPSPVKKPIQPTSNVSSSNGVIQTITVYPPPPAKGGIAINTEDFFCLAEDQFLNDVIIDFYLKYLTLQVLSEVDNQRTHVFSTYFYKRLTSPHTQSIGNVENLSPAAKRHARVKKWTKNVNIFKKDFIVIPINEHAHWFLAIICFPGLVGKIIPKVEEKSESQKLEEKKKKEAKAKIAGNIATPASTITIDTHDDGSERDEAEGDDDELETESDIDDESEIKSEADKTISKNDPIVEKKEIIKVPCILIFDSLAGASRSRVVATLRDYLSCEYRAKMGAEQIFTKDTIKGAVPKVPQQSNFTDCGLYVLQYVEAFFQTPIVNYTLPIKTLKNWFEEITVTRKREEIAKLLTEIVSKNSSKTPVTLPTLTFPTQDGVLKPKSESQAEAKLVKVEVDKKKVIEKMDTTPATEETESTNNINCSSTDNDNKTIATKLTIPVTSSTTPISTTSDTVNQQKKVVEATSINASKTSADQMAYLKMKRIPRLQKSSESLDDGEIATKKLKSDSSDSCK